MGQTEGLSRRSGWRTTYESQVARHRDELKRASRKIEMYDTEEHWHLGLATKAWPIEDIGERVYG